MLVNIVIVRHGCILILQTEEAGSSQKLSLLQYNYAE